MIHEIITYIVAPVVGWVVTRALDVSKRVVVLETKEAASHALAAVKDEDMKVLLTTRFDALEKRLSRIEEKQDRVH